MEKIKHEHTDEHADVSTDSQPITLTTGQLAAKGYAEVMLPELESKLAQAEAINHTDRVEELRGRIDVCRKQLEGTFVRTESVTAA